MTRREFLHRASCGAALLSVPRLHSAGGMYISLNGSLVNKPDQPLPWPDFVRLAGKVGYGGVDVNLGAAFTDGVEATRALLAEARVRPAIAGLPLQFLAPDEAAFQDSLERLDGYAKFCTAIGLNKMMAVLSPGSPVPTATRG